MTNKCSNHRLNRPRNVRVDRITSEYICGLCILLSQQGKLIEPPHIIPLYESKRNIKE